MAAKTQIQYINLNNIVPYANNPRENDGEAVDKVAASIQEYGFNVPLVLDKDNIIVCGHTRYKAAHKLALDDVPCIYVNNLTPAQIKAYRLADNKVAEYASWNDDMLAIEFEQLQELNFDLNHLGFEEWELDSIMHTVTDDDLKDFFVDREDKPKEVKKVKCPECGCEFEK